MKNIFITILTLRSKILIFFLCSAGYLEYTVGQPSLCYPDTAEARKAFELLTNIRANPSSYKETIDSFLKDIKPSVQLSWNDTLAEIARMRAMDMAERGYFDHITPEGEGINIIIHKAGYTLPIDWIQNKKSNSFESIFAGATDGEDAVKSLIIDENIPGAGHRKHLLGLTEWYGMMKDIGIGFIQCDKSTKFISYTCIIIAVHDWQ